MLDRPPVFVDPLATALLSDEARAALAADPRLRNRPGVEYLRAFLAVRSRIAEDRLADAFAAGVRQYVLLGAGLDTFAHRNPFAGLRVFEVDHPKTQAWKRERLKAAGLAEPPTVTYVPVDFHDHELARELAQHGFDGAQSAAISWLGTVPYLETPAVWATLEWAASVVGESGHIIFDYGHRPRWWQLRQRLALWMLGARVKRAGEPFRTTFEVDTLRRRLQAIGFTVVEDLDASAINPRYFAARADGLRVGAVGHVVIASRRTS